jgi:hypothetical protein
MAGEPAGGFLQSEKHPPDGRPESGRHSCGSAASDEIPPVPVVPGGRTTRKSDLRGGNVQIGLPVKVS